MPRRARPGPAPQAELARGIPRAVAETIPGAGHALTLEAPLEAERVCAFLAGESRGN